MRLTGEKVQSVKKRWWALGQTPEEYQLSKYSWDIEKELSGRQGIKQDKIVL